MTRPVRVGYLREINLFETFGLADDSDDCDGFLDDDRLALHTQYEEPQSASSDDHETSGSPSGSDED